MIGNPYVTRYNIRVFEYAMWKRALALYYVIRPRMQGCDWREVSMFSICAEKTV